MTLNRHGEIVNAEFSKEKHYPREKLPDDYAEVMTSLTLTFVTNELYQW